MNSLKIAVVIVGIVLTALNVSAHADDSMSILINQKLYASPYKADSMLDLIESIDSASQRTAETNNDDEIVMVIITTDETY